MAIDDLLYQADQTRARQGYGPRRTATADTEVRERVARLRANGRLPGGQAAAPAGAAPEVVTTGARTGAQQASSASAEAAATTRGGALSRLARGAGRVAAPVVLGASGAQTARTPTETYYERFGLQPRNDGTITGDLLPNLGIRALGAASDLGDTLTAGIAGNLFFRDRQAEPSLRADTAAQFAAMSPVEMPGHPQPQSDRRRIYQRGNEYSDQPIAGGVEFNPTTARGGFASTSGAVPAAAQQLRSALNMQEIDRAQRQADRDERVQRQRDDFNAVQMQRAITGGTPDPAVGATAASQAANERRATLRLLQNAAQGRNGVSAHGQREALAALAGLAKSDSGRIELAPSVDRSPQSPTELLRAQSAGALEDEQAIAAGLSNQQIRRQQQIMEQIAQIGAGTPTTERRALIDRALISQGKDPDANRFEPIESVGGNEAFPIKTRSLYDTRTGQIIGGGAVGQPDAPKPTWEQFMTAARADPRNKAYSNEQLKAYYQRTYGT